MACQFGNFIGTFMEHHTALISRETGGGLLFDAGNIWNTGGGVYVGYFIKGSIKEGLMIMGKEGVFRGTNLEVNIELGSDMEDNPLEVVDRNKKQRTHAGNLNGHINGVANSAWWGLFLGYNVKHRTYVFSDHCPVLVDTISNDRSWMVREQNWFQLSADWVIEDTCEEGIDKLEWGMGNRRREDGLHIVVGNKISDNIIIAYELLHALKKKKSGSRGLFTLKLDMSKVYDKVE
ncbi:hypothetical protein Goshw_014383 [Gossypium schwendimanii]|uniref:Reverse transcriptase n=1 Tax=Gossypium schwendimanii TaxID=34291 RepID=A0A7J9MI82_GOSSC|nr:hypothetical protein [Gossypium schwendimanii]